jgi:hypothetical protein
MLLTAYYHDGGGLGLYPTGLPRHYRALLFSAVLSVPGLLGDAPPTRTETPSPHGIRRRGGRSGRAGEGTAQRFEG